MNKTEKIKSIIDANQTSIAFLIGNGIHCQFKDCNLPWDELIKVLWNKYGNGRQKLPKGISLTEIYDIIEMNAIEKSTKKELQRFIGALGNIANDERYKQFLDTSNSGMSYIQNLISKKGTFSLPKLDPEILESFKRNQRTFARSCREWCNSNIEGAESLSDTQCESIMLDAFANPSKLQIFRNDLKREVGNMFPSKESFKLAHCISVIKNLNVPILTTNFDTYMSQAVDCQRYIHSLDKKCYKFTDFYPWNVYYSPEKLDNTLDNFGIWHINGTTDYPRSIRLGLSDYMGCVERARKMIQGNNLNEYFTGKQQIQWIGYNTWLHIIFNKNLFIFGLGLNENEVFLRWLLIQREKYSRLYNCNLKGWYIDRSISAGKELFLKSLGFDIIKVSKDYHELYNALR